MKSIAALVLVLVPVQLAHGQGTAPTFQTSAGGRSYTLAGSDPAQGKTTVISTVVAPITLSFEGQKSASGPFILDASVDVGRLLASPVFAAFTFPSGGTTQYADAMLRTTFPKAEKWHTLLGTPEVKAVAIKIPAGYGYILTSKKNGGSFAVVDIEFLQKELFKQLPKQDGRLVIAMTRNTTFYTEGDATLCCSWGTHGVDAATGNSFVLGTFLHDAPAIVEEQDIQPLTEQLGEFINDPLHDPLHHEQAGDSAGNHFTAWMRPAWMQPGDQGACGGTGAATSYFLLEPTDTNRKNNFPTSAAFQAHAEGVTYHLQNVALLAWYTGDAEGLGSSYSFPDARALRTPAQPCPARGRRGEGLSKPTAAAAPITGPPNGHKLIGYWVGYGGPDSVLPLREVSPQWDTIIVAFASPDHNAPEGTMRFHTPAGLDTDTFKEGIQYRKNHAAKVLISLGGGGEYFTLADPHSIPNFVDSVSRIVSEYGFDGIDIDFESPSLEIDAGDRDFKHPTTPSIVNLIAALRQLHDRFGARFMISLVPEGTQIPAGYRTYGGQFGSYLPIAYGIRDILSFIDVQDYNTPPLEGLDGEIYQAGTVDYHAAMTELLLRGFNVGGDAGQFFPPVEANRVAVGFLTGDTTPDIVAAAMDTIITGKSAAGSHYKLRNATGYPGMIGAMFWTINDDRADNYNFSNLVGPLLHSYAEAK